MVETGFIDKLKNAKDTLFGGGTLTKESDNEPMADLTSDDSSIPEMPPMSEPEPIESPEIKPSKFTSGLSAEKSRVLKDIDEGEIPSERVSKKKKRKGSDDEILPSDVTYPDDTSEIPPMATPEIPKTETPSVEIPKTETPEVPKTETPSAPVIEEYPPEAIPAEDKEGVTGGINKILGKFGKRLPTKEELKSTGEEAIKEGESEEKPKKKKQEGVTKEEEEITPLNSKEREYAILGGYKGSSREQLLSDNKALRAENERIREQILKIDEELEEAVNRSNAYKIETAGLKKLTTDQINARAAQQRLLNADIDRLEKKKDKLQAIINANNKTIKDNNLKISEYDEAVLKGKKIASPRSQIGKKLQKLGEGAEIVSSGVYGGKSFGKGDWFGKSGFLSEPFKRENILRSPLEPVKTSSRGLENITRSTGGSVGRNLMDVSQVRPSKNIAPMGAPGTIYGARQQFDYNVPAKRISLLDASGMTRANINRDILPNLYDTPKPPQIPMQQYKEIVQEDGSVVRVPVPTQTRKAKLFTVSVNRYSKGARINGMKVGVSKVNNRIDRGIKAVDSESMIRNMETFKPIKSKKHPVPQISRGVNSVGSVKIISNLKGLEGLTGKGMGPSRTIKPMSIGARPEIDLGLISATSMGMTTRCYKRDNDSIIDTVRSQERKSKKSEPLAKLGFTLTGIKLNKNLKKLVMKKKSK
jgi:hypothetical protein